MEMYLTESKHIEKYYLSNSFRHMDWPDAYINRDCLYYVNSVQYNG